MQKAGMNQSNPLLTVDYEIPFSEIKAGHVEPAVDAAIEIAKRRQAQLGAAGERTFENTMRSFDRLSEELDYVSSVVSHLDSVATYPEFRAAYDRAHPKYSEYYSGILLSDTLWASVRRFSETEEASGLQGVERRFLEEVLKDFRQMGAELSKDKKQRLQEIDVELSKITTSFSHNVLDATNAFELLVEDPARLAGLPESAIQAAEESARSKGKKGYRFTLQQPSVIAVLTYLDDASIREEVYRANNTRSASGKLDNRANILKILALREEKASILGFKNFADLVLNRRMAKSAKKAQEFIADLNTRIRAKANQEHTALQAFRDSLEGHDSKPLQAWDVAYYAEKYRRKLFDFDQEELRPYFPFERVISGAFSIAEKLYGIKIAPSSELPVWHEEVRTFDVNDSDGRRLGAFYADFFPRESKRGGAWMNQLVTGELRAGMLTPHLGVICGNFNRSVADKPALLTHDEVNTLLHEFGHLMHGLLSTVPIKSLSGTNVAWDFVELPSQIMENWCWERESLNLLSYHYQSGEHLPDELFQKLKRSQTFRAASFIQRQLGFAAVDLMLHTGLRILSEDDLIQKTRGILQDFSAVKLPDYHASIASFSHLFSGAVAYAAGYYSYQWAEVLDADAFSRFRKEGILNPKVGAEFRENILSKGNSEDAEVLFRRFMGRDPDLKAYLERSGL